MKNKYSQSWQYLVFQYIKEGGKFNNWSTGKKALYNRILQHPQVMQTSIKIYCRNLSIEDQAETQLVPKLSLRVLFRELYNMMVSSLEDSWLEEARNAENNIIINYSILRNILPPQLKKMTAQYKIMRIFECWLYTKSVHSSLLTWRNNCMKHIKYRSRNAQNRRYGEISSPILETYMNAMQNHGSHLYNTSVNMSLATMCPCNYKYHKLLHCKCVLYCCDKCQFIFQPREDTYKNTTQSYSTTRFIP